MRNYSEYGYSRLGVSGAERGAVLGKVFGLLAFAFLFTALGVLAGSVLGPGSFLLSLIGTFGSLIVLMLVRERAPVNLILLYLFATFEGMFLGPVLDQFLARGLGNIVLDAAAGTAGVTLLAGAYGYTTKRDLSGLGGVLFVGLIGIVIASLVGLFLHLPMLYLAISAIAVVVFAGYIVYDLNNIANAHGVTEGDTILFAVSVYLDMFNIFISLLNILSFLQGQSSDD